MSTARSEIRRIPMPVTQATARLTKPRHYHNVGITETYEDDEFEFMMALEKFKKETKRRFPSCCDVLYVLKTLGYAKSEQKLKKKTRRN